MRRVLLYPSLIALSLCLTTVPAWAADYPSPPRECRAAWVATVSNIDWPSKKGLSTEEQQKEMRAILDTLVKLKLNLVIFQIRPMCDALYASKLEPWSEFLTGTMGKAPDPYYDPLETWVKESHARGLEIHVWFNPYRAHHPSGKSPIASDHIVKTNPELAPKYGTHYWMNPTNPKVMDRSLAVINDVVKRYDIDGIHLDDYFYPYKETVNGQELDFPDDDTWTEYQKSGGKLSRADWRRDAVNRFVKRMYDETKAAKPWVKVGISPFGIWKPGHPAQIKGFNQYEGLYADAKLWLNEGWVDYYTPQLYWSIKPVDQSYPLLLGWWAGENTKGRNLWPGNAAYRLGAPGVRGRAPWPATELADQIKATRAQPGATGNVYFSMKSLQDNMGVIDSLKQMYTEDALVPASSWLAKGPPEKPKAGWKDNAGKRSVQIESQGENTRLYVVRSLYNGEWTTKIVPANAAKETIVALAKVPERVVITAIDRVGNESDALTLN